MSEIKNNYIQASCARRAELTSLVFERTNGFVVRGPFQSMKILPKWEWGDSDCAGKLLGIYECELYDSIEEVIQNNHDLIMNIGCAEGFYGVGFGMRTDAQIVMIDPFVAALNIARENANANKVNKILFSSESHPEVFRHYLQKYKNPFIFMDCEGAEEDILDLAVIPELAKTAIMVESHDCNRPGLTDKLVARFAETHQIKLIRQGNKNPYMPLIDDLDDYDKMLLCVEARPSTMIWLYMYPK
jgi:hypothetical protein